MYLHFLVVSVARCIIISFINLIYLNGLWEKFYRVPDVVWLVLRPTTLSCFSLRLMWFLAKRKNIRFECFTDYDRFLVLGMKRDLHLAHLTSLIKRVLIAYRLTRSIHSPSKWPLHPSLKTRTYLSHVFSNRFNNSSLVSFRRSFPDHEFLISKVFREFQTKICVVFETTVAAFYLRPWFLLALTFLNFANLRWLNQGNKSE